MNDVAWYHHEEGDGCHGGGSNPTPQPQFYGMSNLILVHLCVPAVYRCDPRAALLFAVAICWSTCWREARGDSREARGEGRETAGEREGVSGRRGAQTHIGDSTGWLVACKCVCGRGGAAQGRGEIIPLLLTTPAASPGVWQPLTTGSSGHAGASWGQGQHTEGYQPGGQPHTVGAAWQCGRGVCRRIVLVDRVGPPTSYPAVATTLPASDSGNVTESPRGSSYQLFGQPRISLY